MSRPQPPQLGPAAQAARRAAADRTPRGAPARAYPLPLDGRAEGDAVVLAATRALLSVRSRAEAAAVLRTAVNDLGGGVVPARLAGPGALPVDVSLGHGEPMVVVAESLSLAALHVAQHLPVLVQDALLTAARCDAARLLAQRTAVDVLATANTQVAVRLANAQPGDVVCLVDLARSAEADAEPGCAAGDQVLQALGALLLGSIRDADFCAPRSRSRFLVVLTSIGAAVASSRMTALGLEWTRSGQPTAVCIGIAEVDGRGGHSAERAAGRALSRAWTRASGATALAAADEYGEAPP